MTYLYGWSWNNFTGEPVDEMTEEQARAAFEAGPQLAVSAGADLRPGAVPDYTLELSPHAEDVRVLHYTPEGSVEAVLDWTTRDGRLFLEEVAEYLYPDDGQIHREDQATAVRAYFYRPDGSADLTTDIAASPEQTVERFTDVDVSEHWAAPLSWGEWDRIGARRSG